jgi:hypothetical protein
VIRRSLENFYYWVNFAPITRGTSATGYATLYSAILAVGEELVDRVPYNVQLDWEAMFTPDPAEFVERVLPWISNRRPTVLPPEMLSTHEAPSVHSDECIVKQHAQNQDNKKNQNPKSNDKDCQPNSARVSEVFDSLGDVVYAMNAIGEVYYSDILKNATHWDSHSG